MPLSHSTFRTSITPLPALKPALRNGPVRDSQESRTDTNRTSTSHLLSVHFKSCFSSEILCCLKVVVSDFTANIPSERNTKVFDGSCGQIRRFQSLKVNQGLRHFDTATLPFTRYHQNFPTLYGITQLTSARTFSQKAVQKRAEIVGKFLPFRHVFLDDQTRFVPKL